MLFLIYINRVSFDPPGFNGNIAKLGAIRIRVDIIFFFAETDNGAPILSSHREEEYTKNNKKKGITFELMKSCQNNSLCLREHLCLHNM